MLTMIKLTYSSEYNKLEDDCSLFVRIDRIESMAVVTTGGPTQLNLCSGASWLVEETPEQILKLIEEV